MDESTPFSRELVQAVSDWQRKPKDRKQRYKKATALQAACQKLPAEFRETQLTCYRQMALDKSGVWKLLGAQAMDEQISSWTLDMAVAKTLFGGVPEADNGLTEVIFVLCPKAEQVVVNLKKLLNDMRFQVAVEQHKASVDWFYGGTGKYGNEQSEVVLDVGEMSEKDIWTFGGRSSNFEELVYRAFVTSFQRDPATQAEFDAFHESVREMENEAGARWLEHESTKRVLNRVRPQAEVLLAIQQQREAALAMTRAEIEA